MNAVKQYMFEHAHLVQGQLPEKRLVPDRPACLVACGQLGADLLAERRVRNAMQLQRSMLALRTAFGYSLAACANFGEPAYPLFLELDALHEKLQDVRTRLHFDATVVFNAPTAAAAA